MLPSAEGVANSGCLQILVNAEGPIGFAGLEEIDLMIASDGPLKYLRGGVGLAVHEENGTGYA